MARKQDVIFKGSKDGLRLIFNDQQDYEILKEKLKAHLQKAELFFQGADVVLDIGNLEFSIDQILRSRTYLRFPMDCGLGRLYTAARSPGR